MIHGPRALCGAAARAGTWSCSAGETEAGEGLAAGGTFAHRCSRCVATISTNPCANCQFKAGFLTPFWGWDGLESDTTVTERARRPRAGFSFSVHTWPVELFSQRLPCVFQMAFARLCTSSRAGW